MNTDNIAIRLEAIELAITRLSTAITENGGGVAADLEGHIAYLRDYLSNPDITSDKEAVFHRAINLLDPLSVDPWEPF